MRRRPVFYSDPLRAHERARLGISRFTIFVSALGRARLSRFWGARPPPAAEKPENVMWKGALLPAIQIDGISILVNEISSETRFPYNTWLVLGVFYPPSTSLAFF